jgi:hypothetical protein
MLLVAPAVVVLLAVVAGAVLTQDRLQVESGGDPPSSAVPTTEVPGEDLSTSSTEPEDPAGQECAIEGPEDPGASIALTVFCKATGEPLNVYRSIGSAIPEERLRLAVDLLLAGVNDAERERGLDSPFQSSGGALLSMDLSSDGSLTVDFDLGKLVQDVPESQRPEALLSLNSTILDFSNITSIIYHGNGDRAQWCAAFQPAACEPITPSDAIFAPTQCAGGPREPAACREG